MTRPSRFEPRKLSVAWFMSRTEGELQAIYNEQKGLRRPSTEYLLTLQAADPLFQADRRLADRVYGLDAFASKSRGTAARRAHDAVWGDDLDALVQLAIWFRSRMSRQPGRGHPGLNARAARVAVAFGVADILGRRKIWFGRCGTPVAFAQAVKVVRQSMAKSPRPVPGDTGRKLFVRPAAGMSVRCPTPPHAFLPEAGALVPDNLYWRRRIKEGGVYLA